MTAQDEMFVNRRLCVVLCDELGLVTLATKLRSPKNASAWSMREPLAEVYAAADAIHQVMVTMHESAGSTVVDEVIGPVGVRALKLKEAAERAGAAAQKYVEESAIEKVDPRLASCARRMR